MLSQRALVRGNTARTKFATENFYLVIAEKWLVVSLPNIVTIRGTHWSISCKIFSWIRTCDHDETEDIRHGILRFYKGFCKPKWFICTLLTDRNEHVAAKADSSLSNRRASLSRSLATGLSVDSRRVYRESAEPSAGLKTHPHAYTYSWVLL